jgi:Rps23 Pro-64 3,4-dihydroxylase Tpa1-like proline 4-hydroxylase
LAKPFPHIVIEDFIHPRRLDTLSKAFPSLTDVRWYTYENIFERKYAYNDVRRLPQPITDLMWDLNSAAFLSFLEELTGIPDLIADDGFRGGGLHCISTGGKLDIHADFNIHPETGLHRRLNAILFLNEDWKPEYGGAFELWNRDMTACEARILPILNRMVIFSVTDTSFHGHPEPLNTPDGVSRKSMAWYYYTKDRPANELSPMHSTLYQKLPGTPECQEIEEMRVRRAQGRLADQQLKLSVSDTLNK